MGKKAEHMLRLTSTQNSAATAAEVTLLCHRQSRRTTNRPLAKVTPTDYDLQPNSHMQP